MEDAHLPRGKHRSLGGDRPGGKPCLGLAKEVSILAVFALYYWGHVNPVEVSTVAWVATMPIWKRRFEMKAMLECIAANRITKYR